MSAPKFGLDNLTHQPAFRYETNIDSKALSIFRADFLPMLSGKGPLTITIGDKTFVNVNGIFVAGASITIGEDVIFGGDLLRIFRRVAPDQPEIADLARAVGLGVGFRRHRRED